MKGSSALLVKRKDGLFSPAYQQDFDACSKVEAGEIVSVKLNDVRNVMHHRKFFALLNLVHHHMNEGLIERLPTVNHLLHELKIRLGHYDLYVSPKGNPMYMPKSISFESMGQAKFDEFYSGAMDVILKHYLTGWDEGKIEDEILNFF